MQTFDESARFYDLIYLNRKDYAAEARRLCAIAEEFSKNSRRHVLDVACGTGEHLRHLQPWADQCTGADASAEMLKIASTKLPCVNLQCNPMDTFHFTQSFDVICCLFAAIGYVANEQAMRASVANMARHLAPGGVLLIEPALTPEQVQPPTKRVEAFDDQIGTKLQRITTATLDDNVLRIRFDYTLQTTSGERQFTEEHPIQLFTDDTYRAAFKAAGLAVEHDAVGLNGAGLYIATNTIE